MMCDVCIPIPHRRPASLLRLLPLLFVLITLSLSVLLLSSVPLLLDINSIRLAVTRSDSFSSFPVTRTTTRMILMLLSPIGLLPEFAYIVLLQLLFSIPSPRSTRV